MSSDFSRDSFDALRDYAGVFLQQGRAVLDSDWNELVQLMERRIRSATVDTIGRAVVPRETPLGFEIQLTTAGLGIGRGRLYLDGVSYENHGAADFGGDEEGLTDPVFDRARPGAGGPEGVLDEMIAAADGDFLAYEDQPYWPTPDPLPAAGAYLVYLVGWRRAVTATEFPGLLEPALGGLDSTTRWQNAWQVRVLPNLDDGDSCATPVEELPGWVEETAPSTARLSTGTIDVDDPEDPCLVPPTEGYTGIENQFYRVEIHSIGERDEDGTLPTQGAARFKFSRENASVRASVVAVADDRESVTVGRIGRDEVLRFRPGDWVEITDDHREFNHRSGQMLRVADVDPETREIDFEGAIDPGLVPAGDDEDTLATRHTRLVRWDQSGIIRLDDGTEWADLDADGADGLIRVPPDDRAIVLESGIVVSFTTADGPGSWREMDYWRFAARTAGTPIEILHQAPPDGIQRHYTRLAFVQAGGPNTPGSVFDDCREFWPPEFTAVEEGCACTVCVTPESHDSGRLTIQDAVDQVGAAGGTVCLVAGLYTLEEPVLVRGRNAIRILGQGLGTILVHRGAGGAVQVETCVDVGLERFTVLAAPSVGDDNIPAPVHGITALNTAMLALRRLAVLVASPTPSDRFDFGIALDGVQLATRVEECVSVGAHALGSRSSYGRDEDGDLQFAAFAELRALDCILFGGRDAVRFDRVALNLAAARLSRNLVLSTGTGIRINWAELPAASLAIEGGTVGANRHAMVLSAGTLRVENCEISGGETGFDGIYLASGPLPKTPMDAQIIGNTIFDTGGAGIRLAGLHDTVFIKRNVIRGCLEAGIATGPDGRVRHISVDNNSVENIARSRAIGEAAAIALSAVQAGQIAGNRVRGVGAVGSDGQRYAGIAVQGLGSVEITGNTLSEIGGQTETRSACILVQPPYLGVTVTGNQVYGRLDGAQEASEWQAIRVGPMLDDREVDEGGIDKPAKGHTSELPVFASTDLVYVDVAENTWAASARHFAILLPVTRSQITVSDNQGRAAQALGSAMVSIVDARALGLTFGGNQFDLQFEGGLREVVLLGAPRVAASGNQVTHSADATSLRIVTGQGGAATPVGNITRNTIALEPGGLPPAFAALNLTN